MEGDQGHEINEAVDKPVETGVRAVAVAMRARTKHGASSPRRFRPAQLHPGQTVNPIRLAAVAGRSSVGRGAPGRRAANWASRDLAANERALGEGARATERDARTAEYDWRETLITAESASLILELADQEHATAEVSADIAAAHESAAGVFASQGYEMDTRQALASCSRSIGTATRGRSASPMARGRSTGAPARGFQAIRPATQGRPASGR
jgi:hypothetical protein